MNILKEKAQPAGSFFITIISPEFRRNPKPFRKKLLPSQALRRFPPFRKFLMFRKNLRNLKVPNLPLPKKADRKEPKKNRESKTLRLKNQMNKIKKAACIAGGFFISFYFIPRRSQTLKTRIWVFASGIFPFLTSSRTSLRGSFFMSRNSSSSGSGADSERFSARKR